MSVKTNAQTAQGPTKPATASGTSIARPLPVRAARAPAKPAKRDYGDFHPAYVAIAVALMIGGGTLIWSQNGTNVAVAREHRIELRKKADKLEIEANKRRVGSLADRLASFPPSGG